MRILHVIPGVAARYGGPSAALLPMCAALSRISDLHLETATTDADGPDASLTQAEVPDGPVPVRLFRRDFSEQWKVSRLLSDWLDIHVADYDLVHVHAV